jgi:hypothetical protein
VFNISSKKCYNHFEIRIYTVFHPKNCKKMLKIIFSGHPKGLSPGECIVFKNIEQCINQANDECKEFGAY